MAAAAQFNTSEYTVLLVNSNRHARCEQGLLLRRGGYQTLDFDRAIELLAAPTHVFHCSCVLSELALPDMNSVDMVRSMRERAIQTPVIVLAEHADVRTAVHALRNDVTDFLLKPIAEHELLTRVESALLRFAGQPQPAH
jgi:FixJ family two-component response regulator